jgi:hypothetical protein
MPLGVQNTGTNAAGRKFGTDFKYQVTGTAASGRKNVNEIWYQESGNTIAGRKLVWKRQGTDPYDPFKPPYDPPDPYDPFYDNRPHVFLNYDTGVYVINDIWASAEIVPPLTAPSPYRTVVVSWHMMFNQSVCNGKEVVYRIRIYPAEPLDNGWYVVPGTNHLIIAPPSADTHVNSPPPLLPGSFDMTYDAGQHHYIVWFCAKLASSSYWQTTGWSHVSV